MAQIINNYKTNFGETKITVETIHLVLKQCMEFVDNLNYSGIEKKEIVIIIIRNLINHHVDDDREKRMFLEVIDNKLLENTIGLIILATKGKLNVNNKKICQRLLLCTKSYIFVIIDLIVYMCDSIRTQTEKSIPDPHKPITPPSAPPEKQTLNLVIKSVQK